MTTLGFVTIPSLNIMSFAAAGGWFSATFALSRLIPRKAKAQALVEERIRDEKKSK